MFFLLRRRIKFFFQRLFRGWDNSETWDLEYSFHKWLLPRLKKFRELTCAYPCFYNKLDDWQKELDRRIAQLDSILNINEFDFEDRSYIPKEEYKKWVKRVGNKGTTLNAISYDYCVQDFNKWFCDNLNQLWW